MNETNRKAIEDLRRRMVRTEARIERIERHLGIYYEVEEFPCVLAYEFCGHAACKPKEK